MRKKISGRVAQLRERIYWETGDLIAAALLPPIEAKTVKGQPVLTYPRLWSAESGRQIHPITAQVIADTLAYAYAQKQIEPEEPITQEFILRLFAEDQKILPKAERLPIQRKGSRPGRKRSSSSYQADADSEDSIRGQSACA